MAKKVLLMILDGWGITPEGAEHASAVAKAQTPFIDRIWKEYPHCRLMTHGPAAGLPEGQMGNSQVGHMNLGAGRVVFQDLMRINMAIEKKELDRHKKLLEAFRYAKEKNKPVHILGVLSDGGIHGHIDHIQALTELAKQHQLSQVFVHAFTDGRDTDPKSGLQFLELLQRHLEKTTGKIATLTGRYYAIDRDKHIERTALAYHAMVNAEGEKTTDLAVAIKKSYRQDITDEFIRPLVHTDKAGRALACIREGDVVIFSNFRNDRARQLTAALTQEDFPEQRMKKMNLVFIPFKKYDENFGGMEPLFEDEKIRNNLGEILSKHHKTQLRIAETEKYAHVTYFFNNGKEEPWEREERIIVPSPRDVEQYDEKPEMSAYEVRDKVIEYIRQKSPDFICLNFANPDMVAHTGNFEATVKACETVDRCAEKVSAEALDKGYSLIILADHGNAESMINADGSPNTNHSTNPVPCILITDDKEAFAMKDGKLSDIAPTVLQLMELETPEEMSGRSLITKIKKALTS